MDGDVARLRLGPEQRGTEHDGQALDRHPVHLAVLRDPGGEEEGAEGRERGEEEGERGRERRRGREEEKERGGR